MARVIWCPERPLHIAMLCRRELNMRRKKKRAQLQIKQLQISPAFHKFTLCNFTFKKRPTLLVFTNQKKSQADTCFNKKKRKKRKEEQHSSFVLQRAINRGGSVCTPSSERGPPSPYLGATPAPSLCRCELCELLCFISWFILCIH